MLRVRLLAWLLVSGLGSGGCAVAKPLVASAIPSERTMVSPPGEDGTRYLAVEGGPLTSPRVLRSRWKATARRVCEGGEYQELSEASLARRQGGVTRTRTHEGYVRCLLPSEGEPGSVGAPTMADAS
ncbi:hypothetical protein [Paraliomyxa miuraensis]|uniref:hypothetical protein n=1 Tax=Paraliomyxa miuraensis TaxID=376150 RepID=UPI002250826D|nr:hypothetical protein [Paraliomyxa miuraensis]MCX4245256.1 hypothetical protein [Paraliomyxa miuraensis]